MSLKTSRYWDTHKRVYQDRLDELDDDIRKVVLDYPNAQETMHFNDRVEREVKDELKKTLT